MSTPSNLKSSDLLRVLDLYFNEKHVMYNHAKNSYNQFIDQVINKTLIENKNVFFSNIVDTKQYVYRLVFSDVKLLPPHFEGEETYMFPEDARQRHFTYSSKLVARVQQVQDIIDIGTGAKTTKIIDSTKERIPIAEIPIMVKSKFCNTQLVKSFKNKECAYDPGTYFIVNGSEKVVLTIETICFDKILVFAKKDPAFARGRSYSTMIMSTDQKEIYGTVQKLGFLEKKDGSIVTLGQEFHLKSERFDFGDEIYEIKLHES